MALHLDTQVDPNIINNSVRCGQYLLLQYESHYPVVLSRAAGVEHPQNLEKERLYGRCARLITEPWLTGRYIPEYTPRAALGSWSPPRARKVIHYLAQPSLKSEFRNHADMWNPEPALVSGSDRIVDTLKRAFDKHYEDRELSADIWIAFIEVPPNTNETATRIHSAKELAKKCKLPEPNKFSHEVIFEWGIPEKYVVHKVSLQTLLKRGLDAHCFFQPSTTEVRCCTARIFQQQGPWDTGITLGSFAQNFGARAPLNWISYQLFHDCVWTRVVDNDVVMLCYAHEQQSETVDFQFFGDFGRMGSTLVYTIGGFQVLTSSWVTKNSRNGKLC